MNDKMKFAKALALITQLGLSIALPILFGVWLGNRVDTLLETSPLFLLVLMFVGIITGFSSAYRLIMSQQDGK